MEYKPLDELEPEMFLPLLNKQKIRTHLVEHPLFNADTARAWLLAKGEVDAAEGCRVRAIVVDGQLAGWCGIQRENGQYELAVVLDDGHWGLGKTVFRDMMGWARDLGHDTVFIHLLQTRPEYRFLRKLARQVSESQLLGRRFTTYELAVGR